MSATGVSSSVKRLGLVVALALLVASIWFLQRPRDRAVADDDPPPPRLPRTSAADHATTPPSPSRIDKVTKLRDADARKQLADRIASAQTARGATRAAPMPRLADDAGTATPLTPTEIKTAMRELVPHLAKCYEDALPTLPSPDFKMTAELTLSGDPDIGTLVDAKALTDDKGTPLPAALDDCFRSTLQLMALPPIAEGDKVEVRYPFEFRAH